MARKVAPFIRLMNGYEVDSCGCWIWKGAKYKNGYGWLKVFGKNISAHRYSYELHKGPIPNGMEILHSCDKKDCINPDHLTAGTHKENMAEAAERGLMKSGVNHPMYGVTVKRPRQSNIVKVMGKIYESQKAAERALRLGSGTVRHWIKTNNPKAELVKVGELNKGDKHGKRS